MYSIYDLGLYLLIYSFLGWVAEAGYYAVTRRKFCNRGVVALPLVLSYGFTFVLLILLLPTLAGRHILSFVATMVVSAVVERIGDHFFQRVGPKIQWNQERSRLLSGTGKGLLSSALVAGVYYLIYLIVHPLLLAGLTLVPELLRGLMEYRMLIYGVVLVFMMLVRPEGLLGKVNFKHVRQQSTVRQPDGTEGT